MSIGTGIVLFVIGAILAFAVNVEVEWINLDLVGYIRVLHENGYSGPVDLEVIGTKAQNYTLEQCCVIAAEARGHMQASLQSCGAR